MRDSIRCTIGSPWNLLANIPAVVRAMFDPQLGFGPRLARYGLSIFSISKHMPKPKNRVIMDKDMTIPMRDGVRLCCDIIRPEGEGPFPVLIIRHPYGRYLFSMPARQFALQGFAVVHVDERGRFGSEGDWYIFRNNEKDGRDLCEWINQQPWSDGQIGGWGSSMLGINQWFLALNNPLVTAIAPNMGCLDIQRFLHYGGAKPLSAMVLLGNWVGNRKNSPMVNLAQWMPPLYRELPISEIIHPSIGKLDWVEDMIAHDSYDTFFDYLSCEGRYESISAPSFSVTGWYDMLCDTMIHDFQKLQATNSEAGKKSRIVIGPWGHYCAPTINELDEYIKYSGLETMRWYQYMFKKVRNGVEEWPPVRYYETGINKWCSSEKWPPSGTKTLRLYMTGDGILSNNKPTDAKPPNMFIYDPSNPVPTIGGDHLFFNVGRKDQAKLESRLDVLVYRTDPIEKPISIAGPITVVLHISTDGPDTDFTAKLVDVCPDGKVWNLRDGIVRLKYREFSACSLKETEPVTPSKIYKVTINPGHMCHRFMRGHRIGLHISSSNFPKFDRNLNTGEEPLTAKTMRTARQQVYHDRDYLSFIELMVF